MKFWHTVLFRHRWHSTGQFRSVSIDGWFTVEEQLRCECTATRWAITRDSMDQLLQDRLSERLTA